MMLLDSDGFNLNTLIKNYFKICDINEKINNYKGVSKAIYYTLKDIAPREVYGLDEKLYTEEMSGSQYRETLAVVERLKGSFFNNLKEISLKALQANISKVTNQILVSSKDIPTDAELRELGKSLVSEICNPDWEIRYWEVTISDDRTRVFCYNKELGLEREGVDVIAVDLPFKINVGIASDIATPTFSYKSINLDELYRLCGMAKADIPLSSILACRLVNPHAKEGDDSNSRFELGMVNCLVMYFKQLQRVYGEYNNYDDLKNLLNEITKSIDEDPVFENIRRYPCFEPENWGITAHDSYLGIIKTPFLDVFHGIINQVKKVIDVESNDGIVADSSDGDVVTLATGVNEFKHALYSIGILNAWMLFIDEYLTKQSKSNNDVPSDE